MSRPSAFHTRLRQRTNTIHRIRWNNVYSVRSWQFVFQLYESNNPFPEILRCGFRAPLLKNFATCQAKAAVFRWVKNAFTLFLLHLLATIVCNVLCSFNWFYVHVITVRAYRTTLVLVRTCELRNLSFMFVRNSTLFSRVFHLKIALTINLHMCWRCLLISRRAFRYICLALSQIGFYPV